MVDIIIPAYNAHSTIEKTLSSIAYQTISEQIKVYLVNDKSNKDYKEIVEKYSKYLNILEIDLKENVGSGLAREAGLEKSSSEFVMFIDSDDVLASPKAVEFLLNKIEKKKLDLVIGKFVECDTDGFYQHDKDLIWLHGKLFRRSFLEKNNIHFNETRFNEDNYFVQCVLLCDPKYEYLSYPTYFWDYNENSITRKNNAEFSYKGIESYIKNMENALTFAINNHGNSKLIGEKSLSVLYAIYYYYIAYEDNIFIKLSKKIKNIYENTKKYIASPLDIIRSQYQYSCTILNKEKIDNSNLSFDEFYRKIGE